MLALLPHSKKVLGSFPAWGAVGTGGVGPPQTFLCGVCMFSPCSQGVSSTKNSNRKTCKKNRPLSCPSLTKTDSSLHLVPGRLQAAHCSWGVLEEGRSRMGKKAENKFTATSSLRVCVCVCVSCVASIYARVCSSVSCVPLKPDNY